MAWHNHARIGFCECRDVSVRARLRGRHRHSPSSRVIAPGGGRCVLGDARAIPIGSGSRDIVVVQGGLHHLLTHADVDDALGEMCRVASAAGRIVIFEPCLKAPEELLALSHKHITPQIVHRRWGKLIVVGTPSALD